MTAFAVLVAAATLSAPAGAQYFGDRYQYEQPWRRQQPQSRSFFSFPFFNPGGRQRNQYDPFMRPPPPVESSKAPSPRKSETTPTNTIVVIGDSLADWLAYGLEETYADAPEIGIERKIRPTSGLIRYEPRNDTAEWSQAVKDALATEKPSAIVVMLGLNDRLPLRDRAAPRPGAPRAGEQAAPPAAHPEGEPPAGAASEAQQPAQGGSYDFHTDKWEELYSKRIDEMIAVLKSKGVPVLWVGLPAVRGTRSTSDMSYLDELYRGRAEKAGIIYVDIWDGFVDENGRYAVQGPDFEGQTRRLRTSDGVHFTKVGAVKLAHYVEHELTRVMTNHIAPVALPGPEETPKAGGPGPRPAVGPVLPLAVSSSGEGSDLLGAGNRPPPAATPDPIAVRVLSRGDPLAAPSGRADDFAWPRPGAGANGTSDATPEPVALTPPVSPTKAAPARTDGKKPADAKNDDKAKAAPATPATRGRHSPSAGLDGGPATRVR